jgi:ABC-2 type transport system permease protein
MKQFLVFIKKEFAHVLRDRRTLLILFGLPVVQILVFGFALTNEVKNSRIVICDYANDESSQALIRKIEASEYFDTEKITLSYSDIERSFKEGKIKAAVIFPVNFDNDLQHLHKAQVQIISDASDPNTGNTVSNYLNAIITDYQVQLMENINVPLRISTEIRMLYNPQLKAAHNFVPGVMALVLMLVCVMMTSISIVREKEMGTMEVLLVSPYRPILVILSKAIPYLLLSLVNVATILLLSVYVLELPIVGSVWLLFLESTLFIITSLSLGLLISTRAKTQQEAMLISMMGMLLPTLIFSGFMFPVENFPFVLQLISNIVPARWFYIIVKTVMVKGLGFSAIWKETLVLVGITVFLLIVSLKNFKKRLA